MNKKLEADLLRACGIKDERKGGESAARAEAVAAIARDLERCGYESDSICWCDDHFGGPDWLRPGSGWDLLVTDEDTPLAAVRLELVDGDSLVNLDSALHEAIGCAVSSAIAIRHEAPSYVPSLGLVVVVGAGRRELESVQTRQETLFDVGMVASDTTLSGRLRALGIQLLRERLFQTVWIAAVDSNANEIIEVDPDLSYSSFREVLLLQSLICRAASHGGTALLAEREGIRQSMWDALLRVTPILREEDNSVQNDRHLAPVAAQIQNDLYECGFHRDSVSLDQKACTLPGWFRATKKWDLAAYDGMDLIALMELKSVSSDDGQNSNNRIEESVGSGFDFGCVDLEVGETSLLSYSAYPPASCYILVVKLQSGADSPVEVQGSAYQTDPLFSGKSRLARYCIAGRRLLAARIYQAVWVVGVNDERQEVVEPDPCLSYARLLAVAKSHLSRHRSIEYVA